MQEEIRQLEEMNSKPETHAKTIEDIQVERKQEEERDRIQREIQEQIEEHERIRQQEMETTVQGQIEPSGGSEKSGVDSSLTQAYWNDVVERRKTGIPGKDLMHKMRRKWFSGNTTSTL
jgi:hypothetical protein